ncbi:MAG: phage baseplate assembly protein V [Hyphomicrobiaceae bacterium]
MDSGWDHYSRQDEQMLFERIRHMIARGVVRSVDDAKLMQEMARIDLETGYSPTKIEHWHPYGFVQHPKAGAEVLALSLGGNRDHMIVIATADRRYRLKVAEGEVAIHDDQSQKVHIKRDAIWVETDKKVVAKCPDFRVGEDADLPRVMTEAGPSSVLKAKV